MVRGSQHFYREGHSLFGWNIRLIKSSNLRVLTTYHCNVMNLIFQSRPLGIPILLSANFRAKTASTNDGSPFIFWLHWMPVQGAGKRQVLLHPVCDMTAKQKFMVSFINLSKLAPNDKVAIIPCGTYKVGGHPKQPQLVSRCDNYMWYTFCLLYFGPKWWQRPFKSVVQKVSESICRHHSSHKPIYFRHSGLPPTPSVYAKEA